MKERTTAGILALLLGGLGVHKFYLGQNLQGIIYLVFCWTFIPAIIAFIEALIFFGMDNDEFNRKYNKHSAFADFVDNNRPTNNYTQSAPSSPLSSSTSPIDKLEELDRLHTLLQKGAITQEEYDYKKRQLL